MPVRFLDSSVFKWPDRKASDRGVRDWARKVTQRRKDVLKIGYFGSYARGDWGVGRDLDVVIVVQGSDLRSERRTVEWDATGLPVPVDLLVYTKEEWESPIRQDGFDRRLARETVWVWEGKPENPAR